MKEINLNSAAGELAWACPSNIAIIKYWGKRPVQIPMNPSISITLQQALTDTRLAYDFNPAYIEPEIRFTFEGKEAPAFEKRIQAFIKGLTSQMPFLAHTRLQIQSANTFPHSSGIASSASAFGALALCLTSLRDKIEGPLIQTEFSKIASNIARQGSGSACRSIFPGFVLWGASAEWTGSSDEYAIPIPGVHEDFHGIRDSILIVESGQNRCPAAKGMQAWKPIHLPQHASNRPNPGCPR